MNKEEMQDLIDDIQGELELTTNEKEKFILNNRRVMNEITNFCEECPSHECCPEDECVLFRIEKILFGEDEDMNKIISFDDLNGDGVNFEIELEDGTKQYVTCFWSSNDIEENDIPKGENIDDYGGIYYEIYDASGYIDGGLMITKEEEFDENKLCKDLIAMSGYSNNVKITCIRRNNE